MLRFPNLLYSVRKNSQDCKMTISCSIFILFMIFLEITIFKNIKDIEEEFLSFTNSSFIIFLCIICPHLLFPFNKIRQTRNILLKFSFQFHLRLIFSLKFDYYKRVSYVELEFYGTVRK